MKSKCGLAVASNVNRISIENFYKCHVTGCSSERSSVTFAGQESRPYSKTGISSRGLPELAKNEIIYMNKNGKN